MARLHKILILILAPITVMAGVSVFIFQFAVCLPMSEFIVNLSLAMFGSRSNFGGTFFISLGASYAGTCLSYTEKKGGKPFYDEGWFEHDRERRWSEYTCP